MHTNDMRPKPNRTHIFSFYVRRNSWHISILFADLVLIAVAADTRHNRDFKLEHAKDENEREREKAHTELLKENKVSRKSFCNFSDLACGSSSEEWEHIYQKIYSHCHRQGRQQRQGGVCTLFFDISFLFDTNFPFAFFVFIMCVYTRAHK